MQEAVLKSELENEFLNIAHEMADAARQITLQYFRTPQLKSDNKLENGFDPVTIADREAEKVMRKILENRRPEDGIIGEEFGIKESTSGYTWVLDPIDGTRGFISGTPTWGTLIGLRDANHVLLGIIDQPYIGERYIGGFGTRLLKNAFGETKLQVKSTSTLSQATIFTTFPEVGSPQEGAAFHRVAQKCQLTRYGMDCYAYALLAAGQIELVIEAGLNSYDILGPIGVIEAAGGIVSNWQGGTALEGGQIIAACSKELHQQAIALLNAS